MTNRKTIFKNTLFAAIALVLTLPTAAKDKTIASPNGKLVVTLSDADGKPAYSVKLNGTEVLQPSRLGFVADFGDLTHSMTLTDSRDYPMEKHYDMTRTKRAHVDFKANATDVTFANAKGQRFVVTFVVDDNNIALRYAIPRQKDDNPKCAVIRSEATSFRFPDGTTTFLCPQITPMTGWERTKPSYEEEYTADARSSVWAIPSPVSSTSMCPATATRKKPDRTKATTGCWSPKLASTAAIAAAG